MPPKQDPNPPKADPPYYVLPIIMDPSQSEIQQALKQSVNIKKDIGKEKILEILKDKGLQQYLEEGQITTQQCRDFICRNLKTVTDQLTAEIAKPKDPKKQAKKDTKKDTKKEQPLPDAIPAIEIEYEKKCSHFFMILDFPHTASELQMILQSGVTIDIVIAISPQIKPGSKKPDYTLLKNQRSLNDLNTSLQGAQRIDGNQADSDASASIAEAKKMMRKYLQLKAQKSTGSNQQKQSCSNYIDSLFVEIEYLKDLSNPDQNQNVFIRQFYKQLCSCTLSREEYQQWKQSKTIIPMITPLRQTIQKEVQVESQDKGKKGGKSEPKFETVEEVIETKYESLPANIRDDLNSYHHINKMLQGTLSRGAAKHSSIDIFGAILDACVLSVEQQLNSSNENTEKAIQPHNVEKRLKHTIKLAEKMDQKLKYLPLNKVEPQHIKHQIRQISYPKNTEMRGAMKFQFPPIPNNTSFLQLAQKLENGSAQSLKVEYIVQKMQQLAKKSNSRIKWDFSDRKYVQKFSASRLQSIINHQLLNDPQIFTGFLESQNTKLLITTRTNPPGRVLYHNSIMPWKVVPDYQNWIDNFLTNQQLMAIQSFYDYPCVDAGNLSMCVKSMMPTDNSVIRDYEWTVGLKKRCMIEICKNQCRFGLTETLMQNQDKKSYVYWHQFAHNLRLRFNTVKRGKNNSIDNNNNNDSNNNENKPLNEQENQAPQQPQPINHEQQSYNSTDCYINCLDQGYTIKNNPYPTIIWNNSNNHKYPQKLQKYRSFGSTGEITSFRTDGSIYIYFPNGDIHIHRNGTWQRIINNIMHVDNAESELSVNTIVEGQTNIDIRQDQLIMITLPNLHRKVIFPDGTQLYEYRAVKNDVEYPTKREIKNPYGPLIRITLAIDSSSNVIGYGSAFSYLGFKNILERSEDGYMFEVFDKGISSHYYIETYEVDGRVHSEEMRLIVYEDSSMLRIEGTSGKIVYISPHDKQLLTEQYLNERWLQLFTTKSNHAEGVFDVDLQNGVIENKDSETNHFIASLQQRSQARIAVSFVNETEVITKRKKLGNGFHVKAENYFLPPPRNSIPARLFAILSDGSGVEYLNESQIRGMSHYSVNEQFVKEKIIKQYCLQINPENKQFMQLSFTDNIDTSKFGVPQVLKAPQTKHSLIPYTYHQIKHRGLELIPWHSDYSLVDELRHKVAEQNLQKTKKLSTIKIQQSPLTDQNIT